MNSPAEYPELEAICSEIDDASHRMKELLDKGSSEDEFAELNAQIADANLRLEHLLTEILAKKRGHYPRRQNG